MRAGLVLSIFPGIGLLDRAFEEVGFTVVRGPDVLWGGDIRSFSPPPGVFHGVLGGPPCQAFSSLAHLVRAQGYEPKFGNLIPEFERVVREARPRWWLMENVPAAPLPEVEGYIVQALLFNNRWTGAEQNRVRRFSFGTTEGLKLHPEVAALEAPMRFTAVAHDSRRTPVAIGGSGKLKKTITTVISGNGFESGSVYQKAQNQAVTAAHSGHGAAYRRIDNSAVTSNVGGREAADAKLKHAPSNAVTSSDGGGQVKQVRYTLAEACRLQGLPEDFLKDAPFTAEGKLKAVANGVPLPMGRAIARAVKRALEDRP